MNSAELKKKYPEEWDAIVRGVRYAWEIRSNECDLVIGVDFIAEVAACAGCIQLHERLTRKQKRKRKANKKEG